MRIVSRGAHGEEVAVDEQGSRGGELGGDGEAQRAVAAAQVEHRSGRTIREIAEEEESAGVDGVSGEDVEGDVEPELQDGELRTGIGSQSGQGGPSWRRGSAPAARAAHALWYHGAATTTATARFRLLGASAERGGGGAEEGVAELGG